MLNKEKIHFGEKGKNKIINFVCGVESNPHDRPRQNCRSRVLVLAFSLRLPSLTSMLEATEGRWNRRTADFLQYGGSDNQRYAFTLA